MAELKKSFDLDLDRLIDTIAKTHNLDAFYMNRQIHLMCHMLF